MFLIYFLSYGCNGGALVFLGGAETSASPSFVGMGTETRYLIGLGAKL